jgi:hypothetical protein
MHEFLPAKQILHRHHIEIVPNCDVCGAPKESIRHVLLDCAVARIFWEVTKASTGVKLPKMHEVSWARDLLHNSLCSRKEATLILCGMWSLWMQRNKR